MLDLGRCLKHAVSKYDAFKWSRAASFGPRRERRDNIDAAPGGSAQQMESTITILNVGRMNDDIQQEAQRVQAAIACVRKALLVAPDYIDATFNLALLLQRNGAFTEAADYWRRYLARDRASEWAMRARRSLKFCEIQVNSVACSAGSHADSD